MKKPVFYSILFSFLLAIAFSTSCKKGDDQGGGGWTAAEKVSYEEVISLQEEVSNKLEDWFLSMDSLEAIAMAQQSFVDNPSVSEATINSKGIAVQYANGIRGGLFLKGKRFDYKKSTVAEPMVEEAVNSLKSVVNGRKMLQMDAAYSEFSYYTNQVHNLTGTNLSRVGISITDYLKDDDVTLDRLTQLAGYGIVDMSGHGIPWPKENYVTEIYYLTGETVSDFTSSKYWDEIKTGSIPIVKTMRFTNGTKYCISPDFISTHNDFSKDTIFFYGGFCYSFLGGWPDIIDDFGDGAYLGFDWSVQGYHCANWDINSLALMSDTSKSQPVNLNGWMNDNNVSKSYTEEGRTISIHYSGDGNLTLWGDVSVKLIALSDDGAPVSKPGEAGVAYPFKCEVVSDISELEYVWDIGDGSSPVTASDAVNITWSENGQYELKVDVKDKNNGNSIGTDKLIVTIGGSGNDELKDFVLSCTSTGCRFGPQVAVQFSPPTNPGGDEYIGWNSDIEWSGLGFSGTETTAIGGKTTITGTLSEDGTTVSFVADLELVSESTGNIFLKYTLTVNNCPYSYFDPDGYPPSAGYAAFSPNIQNYVTGFEGYYVDEGEGTTHTVTGIDWSGIDRLDFRFTK